MIFVTVGTHEQPFNRLIKKVDELKSKYNISELLATILVNKNITTQKEINEFLNPTRNDFFDPFLMNDMDIAIKRIKKAIELIK